MFQRFIKKLLILIKILSIINRIKMKTWAIILTIVILSIVIILLFIYIIILFYKYIKLKYGKPEANPIAIPNLDLNQFSGKWYEIYRSKRKFNCKNISDSTINYEMGKPIKYTNIWFKSGTGFRNVDKGYIEPLRNVSYIQSEGNKTTLSHAAFKIKKECGVYYYPYEMYYNDGTNAVIGIDKDKYFSFISRNNTMTESKFKEIQSFLINNQKIKADKVNLNNLIT